MGDIVSFPGTTYMDEDSDIPIPVDDVLEGAKELEIVVVVGRTSDGEFHFASSSSNMGKLLVLLEGAKKLIVDAIET